MCSIDMETYSRCKLGNSRAKIKNLSELCRLCMTQESELVPIFNNDEVIPLTLRIMACVALEVFEGDGLPDKICHTCQKQLEKSYSFRKKCEVSDLKLRHHLKSIQNNSDEINRNDLHEAQTKDSFVNVMHVGHVQYDIEHIPLFPKTSDLEDTSLSCNIEPKNEIIELENEEMDDAIILKENQDEIECESFEAIAEAVKNTLASPNLNLSGELQMKIDQQPGKLMQVEITTENGSVIIMELTTEDNQEILQSTKEEIPDSNEDENVKSAAFLCSECPQKSELKKHASEHGHKIGFHCGICQKWFPTRSGLMRHERIHMGGKTYQCNICQKCFPQKEILSRHRLTHTISIGPHSASKTSDVQVFNCSLCPKVFCHASWLSRHLVTHIGKSFKCRDCDKSFVDKNSLKKHHRETMHQT